MVMFYGLDNISSVFQTFVNNVVSIVSNKQVIGYDDIPIHSVTLPDSA